MRISQIGAPMTKSPCPQVYVFAFSTKLGWMAIALEKSSLRTLRFGYRSRSEVLAVVGDGPVLKSPPAAARRLVARLRSYARGGLADFSDVEIFEPSSGRASPFARRVIDACRGIPFGETRTYAELARMAGSPRAARAAGRCMAANAVPLIVPCHRVIGSDGQLRGYSAFGGLAMKRRLLALERGGLSGRGR
jgi:O-6-methylguanine DNA methyltransferase